MPPIKKQRQEQESGSEAGDGEKGDALKRLSKSPNGDAAEISEDEGDQQTTFSERLRATQQENDTTKDDKEQQPSITEKEGESCFFMSFISERAQSFSSTHWRRKR